MIDSDQTSESKTEPTTKSGSRLDAVLAFVAVGWLWGSVEVALSTRANRTVGTVVLAGVLASAPAFLLGLGFWLTETIWRRIPGTKTISSWIERTTKRGTDADREPVLRFYAFVLAFSVLVACVWFCSRMVYSPIVDLQEKGLAAEFASRFTAGLVAAAILGMIPVAYLIRQVLRRIDQRRRLPSTLGLWGMWVFFVTLPLLSGVYPVLVAYGSVLGRLRDLAIFVLLASTGFQLLLIIRATNRRISRTIALIGLTAAGLAVAFTGVRYSSYSNAVAAERGMAASLGVRIARIMTDFDRDGASSLFGEIDCAPFDNQRGPMRMEISGNGVDEDCDGSDQTIQLKHVDITLDRFSDVLTPEQQRPYNVVWVIIETLRADHVSAIGYDKPTMPYFTKLAAEESLLFTNAYSQSSATVLSVPSMLSGLEPAVAHWKRAFNHPQIDASELMMAERFQARGYKTGMVLDTYLRHNFVGIHQGFDQLLMAEPDGKRINNRPRRNLLSTARATDFLARLGPNEPFFLTVYFPDTHSPYTRHQDIDSSHFDKTELGNYDTEIAALDEQLHALVETLRARKKLWENTIFIVTADHGEEFEEHGQTRHALTCHIEVTHVPLLVRVPGIAARRIDTPVALVDIAPTVLELVGERANVDRLGGQSLLVPALRPEKLNPLRPIFCSIASITSKYGTFFRRSVRQDHFALFQDVNMGTVELFDVTRDPGEQENISANAENAVPRATLERLLKGTLTGNLRDHTQM